MTDDMLKGALAVILALSGPAYG